MPIVSLSFTDTPTGVYASVSFASTGALINNGPPLVEQRNLLEEQWRLFTELMPGRHTNWDAIQLVDSKPLAWSDYITELEPRLLEIFDPQRTANGDSFLRSCQKANRLLVDRLPANFDAGAQVDGGPSESSKSNSHFSSLALSLST